MMTIPGIKHQALKGTEIVTFDDIAEYVAYCQANPDCHVVKQDHIAGAFLSTVLLPFPLFSSLGGAGDPRLFETMVFYGPEHCHTQMMSRYGTYEAAYAAHVAIAGCMRVLEDGAIEVNEAALTAIWYGVFQSE